MCSCNTVLYRLRIHLCAPQRLTSETDFFFGPPRLPMLLIPSLLAAPGTHVPHGSCPRQSELRSPAVQPRGERLRRAVSERTDARTGSELASVKSRGPQQQRAESTSWPRPWFFVDGAAHSYGRVFQNTTTRRNSQERLLDYIVLVCPGITAFLALTRIVSRHLKP